MIYEFKIYFLRSFEFFFRFSDIDIGAAIDIEMIRIYNYSVVGRIKHLEIVFLFDCALFIFF